MKLPSMTTDDLVTRRAVLAGTVASLLWPTLSRGDPLAHLPSLGAGAQYAWAAFDLESGKSASLNPNLRLPMCSSFKWLLVACVLTRVDRGREQLDRRLVLSAADLLVNSPRVSGALEAAGGERVELAVAALCEAAITVSDNAATNALLKQIGGPAGLTAWLRETGDDCTRLDRFETELNRVPKGDVRDTTTAAAMLGNLRRLLYGTALTVASRDRLFGWMLACETGVSRLPAGLPPDWRIAHKTGTWTLEPGHAARDRAAAGDVGVLIRPRGKPILLAAYTAGSVRPQVEIEAWFAALARSLAAA
jgi:beta-lactamase class A